MRRLFIAGCLTVMASTTLGQIPADSVRAIIKQAVASKRSKSIIVGIIDASGRQVFSEGKLSDEQAQPPDSKTVYEIGSITKVFTSLLLADMSLRQQVSLSDPISKYLPKGVKSPVRNGKEISLLTLSTHRSGMPRFPYNIDPRNIDEPYADYTVDQLYEYVSGFEPEFDIDTRWRYSNTGYGLLGTILTIVADMDLERLMARRICEPLKMDGTGISPRKKNTNVATGHFETGQVSGITELGAIAAGGGMRSNVEDLLTFAAANLGLVATDLLPAMELTHVMQAKKDGDDTYTTMGWTLCDEGKGILYKDGATMGYRSFLGIDKKNKIGVVVLANTSNNITDIGRYILEPGRQIAPYKYPWALLDTLRETTVAKGADSAIALYRQLRETDTGTYIFNEDQLSYLGREMRSAKKIKDAVKIFEWNIKEYPGSAAAYGHLGETYKRSNNKKAAIHCFEKALALEPKNLQYAYTLNKLKR